MKRLLFLLIFLPFAGNGQSLPASTPQQNITAYRSYLRNHLPKPSGWVNDYENILSRQEEADLSAAIKRLNATAKAQFCIVTIDTMATSSGDFDNLVWRIANVWGVGEKGINNGITIGLCKGYHRIRICNGNGIVARLTDADTKAIIDKQMIPLFKKGAYYEALMTGLNALSARLSADR